MDKMEVKTYLKFENGKPYIETVCGEYIAKSFLTVQQAKETSEILLKWVAKEEEKPILMVIGYEEE